MRLPAFSARMGALSGRSIAFRYGLSLAIFAVALAMRFWLDDYLAAGFPYLTFFPAVIISGFILGVGPGSLIAVLSGLASWYFFIPPFFAFDFSLPTMIAMGLYVFVVVTDLLLIYLMTKAYGAEQQARRETQKLAEQQEVMARELDHRLKNLFATANAVISLSQRHADSAKELGDQLRSRFDAMARSTLLLRGMRSGEETTLEAVIRQSLEPFGLERAGRLSLTGKPLQVNGQTVLALSLVFHELGTNAAKYGSIATPDGRIAIDWQVGRPADNAPPELALSWRETISQPIPNAASKEVPSTGFGSNLIQRVITGMGGSVEAAYPPQGAIIDIRLPLVDQPQQA